MLKLARWPRPLTPEEQRLIEQVVADFKVNKEASMTVGDYTTKINEDQDWDLPPEWQGRAVVVSRAHNNFWAYLDQLGPGVPPERGHGWGEIKYEQGDQMRRWAELNSALFERLQQEGYVVMSHPSNPKLNKQYQKAEWEEDNKEDPRFLVYLGREERQRRRKELEPSVVEGTL